MQGQDAVNVARAFDARLPLADVILTKPDGDARGGVALSVRQVTGKPIKFAGVSEKLDGLEQFHPERMASRILGMGDVLSLVEEARKMVDAGKAKKFAEKVKKGEGFDLEDFKQQIGQMRKMGGMSALVDKLPAQFAQAAQLLFVPLRDRKSTRLNSSHSQISYAVFCLKKKKKTNHNDKHNNNIMQDRPLKIIKTTTGRHPCAHTKRQH